MVQFKWCTVILIIDFAVWEIKKYIVLKLSAEELLLTLETQNKKLLNLGLKLKLRGRVNPTPHAIVPRNHPYPDYVLR